MEVWIYYSFLLMRLNTLALKQIWHKNIRFPFHCFRALPRFVCLTCNVNTAKAFAHGLGGLLAFCTRRVTVHMFT